MAPTTPVATARTRATTLLVRLLLPAAAVAFAAAFSDGFHAFGAPRSQTVHYVLGDGAPHVVELDARWARGDAPMREASFRYAPGEAPRVVTHEPRLADGDYTVEIEVVAQNDANAPAGVAEQRAAPRRPRRRRDGHRACPFGATMSTSVPGPDDAGESPADPVEISTRAVDPARSPTGIQAVVLSGNAKGHGEARRRAPSHRQGGRQRPRTDRRHRVAPSLRAPSRERRREGARSRVHQRDEGPRGQGDRGRRPAGNRPQGGRGRDRPSALRAQRRGAPERQELVRGRDRQEPPHADDLRDVRADREDGRDGAPRGRDRHRQGCPRTRALDRERPGERALRGRRLRGGELLAHRVGALRARERRVHRRRRLEARSLRAGRSRDGVPRRDRRAAARRPAEAPARARVARVPARRRQQGDEERRARSRGDQAQSAT